jgi:hypothetical protein
MTEQQLYDEKLTIIKTFNTYLTDIIDKGYNNNYNILEYIVKHINNFQDELIEESANNNIIDKSIYKSFMDEENMFDDDKYSAQSFKLTSNTSSNTSNTSSSNTEDEDEDDTNDKFLTQHKEKELNKIKKFIDGPDLSKIYLYKKNGNHVKQMEHFILNSLIY